MNTTHQTRRASIYVVTLITVATIVSIILIGTILRAAANARSTAVQAISTDAPALTTAAEFAMKAMADDPIWTKSAQSGVVYANLDLAGTQYDATVTDADTAALPDESTSTYRFTVSTGSAATRAAARFDISVTKPNYIDLLDDLDAEFYWPLTDPEKSTTADEPLDSHDGSYLAPNTAAAAINDEGAPVPLFANTSDHVSIPWNDTFKQGEGSLACWIKCTGPTNDFRFHPFLGMNYQSGGNPTINAAVYNTNIWVNVDDGNDYHFGDLAFTTAGAITKDTWHHITITWGNAGLKLYIDGTLAAHNASNTQGIATRIPSFFGGNQPLFLGAGYDFGDPGTPRKGFVGSVCHAAFFDPDLDDDEIAELAAIKPDQITPALVDGSWTYLYDQ